MRFEAMTRSYILPLLGALLFLSSPLPAFGCSAASCLNRGEEFGRDFIISISHQGKPLQGVVVEVRNNGTIWLSGKTDSSGKLRVKAVPPGDYWLYTDLHGISAGSQCFHVLDRSTAKAKGKLHLSWGDSPVRTRKMEGKMVDLQSDPTASMVARIRHRAEVPLRGVALKLQSPRSGASYRTTTDEGGRFRFDGVPPGIYVLHAEGGAAGDRPYDSADLLVSLDPVAEGSRLLLTRHEPIAGDCGGTFLKSLD